MRLIHLSDIHIWRYPTNPLQLLTKRSVGVLDLLTGRASRFRLERLGDVVERVLALKPDHILITGDLTTLALPEEFQDARRALSALLEDPARVTVLPGNHDRYTTGAVRQRYFENAFGAFAPEGPYPWLRSLDGQTALLGLDPTRPHVSARGYLPPEQLAQARRLAESRPHRLILACHYPLAAPPGLEPKLAIKRLKNDEAVAAWARTLGPHLYCCGHVHAAWAFRPAAIPDQLCLNAGAPLMRDPTGQHRPGFLEIDLDGDDVTARHHAWYDTRWQVEPLVTAPGFFRNNDSPRTRSR